MANIQDRIAKLGSYFRAFNVNDGLMILIVEFPNKWTLFDIDVISEEFNIQITQQNNGLYFLTELANGSDGLFDAVDFIIEHNKELEAKHLLLQEKVKELGEIFSVEPLEKLQNLRFVMTEPLQIPTIPTTISVNKRKTANGGKRGKNTTKTNENNKEKVNTEITVDNTTIDEIQDSNFTESIKEMIGET